MAKTQTHWKKLQNPDFIGAWALDPGKDLIVTIKNVSEERVIGAEGKKDDCIVLRFAERGIKPMILNATNAKTISKLAGSPYIENWTGIAIQIYVDRNIKAFGTVTEGLRIRPNPPRLKAQESYKCANCGEAITGYDDKRDAKYVASLTNQKYGKSLCTKCATEHKAVLEAQEPQAADVLSEGSENTVPNTDEQPGKQEDPFEEFINE